MKVKGQPMRTIRFLDEGVEIIDQRRLPHDLVLVELRSLTEVATAIRDMWLRGAPLIGVAAAAGMWLAARRDPSDTGLERAFAELASTRPTAVNLRWALGQLRDALAGVAFSARAAVARATAVRLAEEDVAACRAIGEHGLPIIQEFAKAGRRVEVLTRCNAGWLATVDWGTALAPIYIAHDAGIPLHVWVPETRPRNQGLLTAWELGQHGVPHTLVADGATGHLLQRRRADFVITGADRVTRNGDVCNKIGTYLQALAARDAGIPFYAAVPGSTIDWNLADPMAIPIEERGGSELTHVAGRNPAGELVTVALAPAGTEALNFAFDVTPARLVDGLVTERGRAPATAAGLAGLYPEKQAEPAR